MPEIITSPLAEEDLFAIWDHIAEDNLGAADRFVAGVDEKFHLLAEQPQIGPAREELAPNLRSFPAGNYVIYYRPIENGVEIVRVLEGHQDITPLFFQL